MDDQNIKKDINAIVEQSPVQRQIQAIKGVKFPEVPDGTSTLVTGDIQGNVADVFTDIPERGVEFTPDTTEVYRGAIASPKAKYNTRALDRNDPANPLYFEPNYQAVAPYTFNTPAGPVESTTLDSQKLAWQIAISNGFDDDKNYLGYRKVPDIGRLSWWSHAVGSVKGGIVSAPYTLAKGAANIVGAGTKALSYTMGPVIAASVDIMNGNPDSIISDVIKATNITDDSSTGIMFDVMNTMLDSFNDAVDPIEQNMMAGFEADPEDNTFRAQSGRAMGSGVTSFGIAALSGNPEVAFTLLNFANANQMRHQALNAGVAPGWAEAYGIVAPSINSWLDVISFDVYMNGLGAATSSSIDYLIRQERSGLFKFLGVAGRQLGETGFEMATEMTQEGIEGAFDPEFWKNPLDRLAIAGLTAVALKAATLPISVRHARAEDQMKLAKALGVEGRLALVRAEAKKLVENWAKEGRINDDQKQILMDKIISEAPDQIIADLRSSAKGQLDKIPAADRAEFARLLQNIKPSALTTKEFEALDKNVETKLTGLNLPESQKEMIKGIVRGLANLKLVQDGTTPSQINVPNFVLKELKSGSEYNALTNTVTISTRWSDTEYTKMRGGNSSTFNTEIRTGFVPSSAQSDRMSSIIHELGHWVDYQMGEKGFADFLEHYYNNIAEVFGADRALAVYNASKQGAKRGLNDGRKTYMSNKNATEWNAQSLSRLGKRAAEQLGLGKSQANRFLSYANMMFNQIGKFEGAAGKRSAETLGNFQTAMQNVIDQNSKVITDLVEAYGTDRLKQAVKDFLNQTGPQDMGMTEYLAQQELLRDLFNVMDTFADKNTLEKVNDIFDSNEEKDNFITRGDMYFRSGYDNAVAEIKEKRAERAAKEAQKKGEVPEPKQAKNNGKQVQLQNGTTATLLPNGGLVGPDGTPNFGGDGGIDAVRALLKPDEGTEEEKVDVWHGTPHRYDRFDLSKARTGEGGIAHGWGVYLTTVKDRAKRYWHNLLLAKGTLPLGLKVTFEDGSVKTIDNILKDYYMAQYFDGLDEIMYNKDEDNALWYVGYKLYDEKTGKLNAKNQSAAYLISGFSASVYNMFDDEVKQIEFVLDDKEEGQLVKAITPDTDTMLQEDKMLIDQTDYVQNKIWDINKQLNLGIVDSGITGKAIYQKITDALEDEEATSRFLSKNGINGIEYDGRIDGRSFVVFDPATIEMLDVIRNTKDIVMADYIPNDYTAGTDPVAEVRQAYEQGASTPVDEVPSYDKEVDGRKLGEDIESLTNGITARAKALPNKIVKWAASSPWGWGLDRIITTMFGREASNKLDIAGKYTRRNALRSGMYGKFMQELAPIIGDVTKDKAAAMFKYKTMLNNLGFVRVKGVEINDPYNSDITTTRDLTGWEVMYVYLMQRMGTKYGNRIQQSTKTNINELIATLSDEEKQFGDAMSKTLRDVWSGIVGEDKAVVNYFPILSATHAALDEVNIDTFKQRMETDDPIAIDDAGRIFSKDISRLASWQSGYYQTLKRLREVLQYKGAEGRNIDPNVDAQMYKASALLAGQISNIFGRDAYHNVLRLLDTQIADPQDQMLDSASSKTLQQMGNNVIKSMLSFKFMSLPKNLANITMMWGGAQDQSTYWNGFAEGIGDMKRTWEYMMKHSNEIRTRYNDAGYNEFLDQRNTGGSTAPIFKGISKIFAGLDWTGDKTGGMAKMSAALDMMGDTGLKMFMLNGDAVANIYGGYGLIKDYMKQGMSEADAFKKLDRYIVEHQSSSNLAMKPLGQLQANKSLAGQVMAFTSEGVAKWASILGTFDEVKMGTATKSEAIANAMSIAMSMLLFTALSAGIWDLWDDDEKVQEEAVKSLEGAMIDQLFGGSVLGNGFLTPAVQGMLGLGGNMGISAPLWSFMTEGVGNLKKGEYDRIITKSMEATGALVGANALYNDIQGLMFMTSPDADIREAGFRMLGGRTPGYAEKRTGAKIRKSSKENVENEDEE